MKAQNHALNQSVSTQALIADWFGVALLLRSALSERALGDRAATLQLQGFNGGGDLLLNLLACWVHFSELLQVLDIVPVPQRCDHRQETPLLILRGALNIFSAPTLHSLPAARPNRKVRLLIARIS